MHLQFLCVACLIYKWWTDYEASRLFFLLEKQSREWPLLNNVTWNQSGSWFADVTFGGYTIICIALFIAHLIGELKSTRKTVIIISITRVHIKYHIWMIAYFVKLLVSSSRSRICRKNVYGNEAIIGDILFLYYID